MKPLKLVFTFCLLFAIVSANADETTPAYGIRSKDPAITAFTNATIQISPVLVIEKGTLVFRNGLIESVGQNVKIPPDATVIDLAGKFIYPGFIDPFTEYGLAKEEKAAGGRRGRGDSAPRYEANREGGNAWNEAIRASTEHVFAFKPDSKASEEFYKIGFTTVQSAKRDGIFRGRSYVALLGDGVPNDLILEPHSLHFLSFDKGTSEQSYPNSMMGSIAIIRQTFMDTDWYQKARAPPWLQTQIRKCPNITARVRQSPKPSMPTSRFCLKPATSCHSCAPAK